MKDKIYLNDILTDDLKDMYDFEEVAEDGARVVVRAPVGAGKNYFSLHGLIDISNKNKRKPDYNKKIFITSRSATTEQFGKDLKKTIIEEKLDMKCARIGRNVGFGSINFECECAKWQDADYIYGHKWDLENNLEEIIEMEKEGRFSFIIIDEIHSASSDDFTTASSAIYDLLCDLKYDTGALLLSACPDRVSARKFPDYEALDYNGICYKVEPKKISVCHYNSAYALARKASENNKILYFVDSKKKAYIKEKELRALGVRANAITSEPSARKEVYDSNIEIQECARISKEVMNDLLNGERFSEEVDIIISTSKLREGINIKDKRCKMIITELRDSVSLIQCVGRVRFGVDELVIVDGLKQFVDTEYTDKIKIAKELIKIENEVIKARLKALEEAENNDNKEVLESFKQIFNDYIKAIQSQFSGLIYYSIRARALKVNDFFYYEQQQRWKDFKDYKEDNLEYLKRVLGRDDITFDNNRAHYNEMMAIIAPFIGKKFTSAERKELLVQMNARLPQNKQVDRKIDTIIAPMGYTCFMLPDRKHYTIEAITIENQ